MKTLRFSMACFVVLMAMGFQGVNSAGADDVAGTSGPFEGLWRVTVTPNSVALAAGGQEFDDMLGFYDGKFLTEAFGMYGFPFGDVVLTGEQSMHFSVTSGSSDYGTTVWSGTKSGNQVSGEMVWTKADGTLLRYTFSGTSSGNHSD